MPRDTLTREQIVEAAVELLDTEGLEGLNMRALGARLSSAATAVYWHVGGKDDIIALAADQVWHEISLPDPVASGWRVAAAAMATDLYGMLGRHPWLVQAFGSMVMYGPGKARHDEHTIAVYEAAGFPGEQADQAAAAVFTYVLGNALGPAAAASLNRKLKHEGDGTDLGAEDRIRAGMTQAAEIAAQFPRLSTRLQTTAATEYGAGPEDSFTFGLDAILDGLEARLGESW
jgi:AcrR family transcriptional regulator